jgi:hypothetical protein
LGVSGGCKVHVHNCRIEHLSLAGANDAKIENCWIGLLECYPTDSSYGILQCSRGGMLDLRLQMKGGFRDVAFRRTWVPRFPVGGEAFDVGQYRKLRTTFASESNSLAAGVFHAAELSMERASDPSRTNRLVGLVYELGCDYGNRLARALGWFLIVLLALGAFAFAGDVGVVAVVPKDLFGWQKSLEGNELGPRFLRSVLLAGQALFNPLNVFGKPLVIAKEPWQALILLFGSLLGILAITMFFISVRRRFKLE